MAKAEGMKLPFDGEEVIKADLLEAAPFDSPKQLIEIETSEFSAVCPWSGLPDIAKIMISYLPDAGKIIELKSLKYYFMTYRGAGVYQERATQLIRQHLEELLETAVEVVSVYNTRGGIDVVCTEGQLKVVDISPGAKEDKS